MIKNMPRVVIPGSKQYVLDMSWVKQWQEYIYYDLVSGESDKVPEGPEPEVPEAICWTNIVKPTNKMILQDTHKDFTW